MRRYRVWGTGVAPGGWGVRRHGAAVRLLLRHEPRLLGFLPWPLF
ncbi:hypothetical protein V6Z12_A11G114100 [Gossypium hirsutum]